MNSGAFPLLLLSILSFVGGIIALADREGMARRWGYWYNEDNPESLKALEKAAAFFGVLFLILGAVSLLGGIVLLIPKS